MLEDYLREGLDCLLFSLRPALFLYAGYVCLGWGKGKRIAVGAFMIREYLWLMWLIVILYAARIVGGHADWTGLLRLRACSAMAFSRGGLSLMAANFLLFVPYGIFTPLAKTGGEWDLRGMTILGAFTSAAIAAFRLALGREAALTDILLNTAGTMCGCLLYQLSAAVRPENLFRKKNAPIDSMPI